MNETISLIIWVGAFTALIVAIVISVTKGLDA